MTCRCMTFIAYRSDLAKTILSTVNDGRGGKVSGRPITWWIRLYVSPRYLAQLYIYICRRYRILPSGLCAKTKQAHR